MALEDIETDQPHFIPGYTGYCPQFIYRVADSYGALTNKLLIDPCTSHAEKLVLSDRSYDDYQVVRPTLREIDLIRNHENDGDPIYRHPMMPGYEGFIPKKNGIFGQRFSIAATQALSDFQLENLQRKCNNRKLRHRGALQSTASSGRSLGERSLMSNDYKLPLSAVRPECKGIIREIDPSQLPKAPPLPYECETKIMDPSHKGRQPFSFPRFGQGDEPLSNSALCDFTNNYQHRRSTEWAPITNAGVGRSLASGPIHEIYHKNVGLIPNYSGHVPGAMFRFGACFGNDSVDAKRWLRSDFT